MNPNIRKAFVMQLNEGMAEEYKRRHSPIWQELTDTLKECGVKSYSIFLLEATHQLFAYLEIEDEARWERIGKTEICWKWWGYMKDIMETHEDSSPVSTSLREVFHLD